MNWNQALFPSLHDRKEGWLRHQENFAQPPKLTQPGGFPFVFIGKPPRPRGQRRLRNNFLIARPPLLAVMQGGESPYSNFFTAHRPPLQSEHFLPLGKALLSIPRNCTRGLEVRNEE